MTITTVSSRQFNQDASGVKKQAYLAQYLLLIGDDLHMFY